MALYDNDGNIRVTVADGNSRGRYAPDGSWYVNVDSGNKGLYGANGCLNVKTWDGTYGVYNPDGGMWLYGNVLVTGHFLNTNSGALHRIFGAGGLDYAFWDYTKTDRTFQEPNGPTLADDAGEAVGLWIGCGGQGSATLSEVLAAQTERVANGNFAAGTTGWSASGATLSAASNELTVTSTSTTQAIAQQVISGLTIGRLYRLSVNVTKLSGAASTGVYLSGLSINSNYSNAIGTTFNRVAYFVATATSHTLNLDQSATNMTAGQTAKFSSVSVRLVPAHYAQQTGAGSLKGVRQTGGIKFDGGDDRELTDWTGNNHNQPNIIMWDCEAPATLATSHFVAGGVSSGFGNNFIAGFGAAGKLRANVGAAEGTADYGPVIAGGSRNVCAVHSNGLVGKIYLNGALVGTTGAVNQTTSGAMPGWTIGSYSNAGTPSGFFGGAVRRIAFGKMPTFTEAEFIQIENEWRNAT